MFEELEGINVVIHRFGGPKVGVLGLGELHLRHAVFGIEETRDNNLTGSQGKAT